MTSTLVDVRTADHDRIELITKAATDRHKLLTTQLTTDRTQLTDAEAKVRGTFRCTADEPVGRVCYVGLHRASRPHARVIAVETETARHPPAIRTASHRKRTKVKPNGVRVANPRPSSRPASQGRRASIDAQR